MSGVCGGGGGFPWDAGRAGSARDSSAGRSGQCSTSGRRGGDAGARKVLAAAWRGAGARLARSAASLHQGLDVSRAAWVPHAVGAAGAAGAAGAFFALPEAAGARQRGRHDEAATPPRAGQGAALWPSFSVLESVGDVQVRRYSNLARVGPNLGQEGFRFVVSSLKPIPIFGGYGWFLGTWRSDSGSPPVAIDSFKDGSLSANFLQQGPPSDSPEEEQLYAVTRFEGAAMSRFNLEACKAKVQKFLEHTENYEPLHASDAFRPRRMEESAERKARKRAAAAEGAQEFCIVFPNNGSRDRGGEFWVPLRHGSMPVAWQRSWTDETGLLDGAKLDGTKSDTKLQRKAWSVETLHRLDGYDVVQVTASAAGASPREAAAARAKGSPVNTDLGNKGSTPHSRASAKGIGIGGILPPDRELNLRRYAHVARGFQNGSTYAPGFFVTGCWPLPFGFSKYTALSVVWKHGKHVPPLSVLTPPMEGFRLRFHDERQGPAPGATARKAKEGAVAEGTGYTGFVPLAGEPGQVFVTQKHRGAMTDRRLDELRARAVRQMQLDDVFPTKGENWFYAGGELGSTKLENRVASQFTISTEFVVDNKGEHAFWTRPGQLFTRVHV